MTAPSQAPDISQAPTCVPTSGQEAPAEGWPGMLGFRFPPFLSHGPEFGFVWGVFS